MEELETVASLMGGDTPAFIKVVTASLDVSSVKNGRAAFMLPDTTPHPALAG